MRPRPSSHRVIDVCLTSYAVHCSDLSLSLYQEKEGKHVLLSHIADEGKVHT